MWNSKKFERLAAAEERAKAKGLTEARCGCLSHETREYARMFRRFNVKYSIVSGIVGCTLIWTVGSFEEYDESKRYNYRLA